MKKLQPAVRIKLSAEDKAPKWNKIFTQGEHARRDMPNGKLSVTTADFQQAIDNWRAMGGNPLPIDRFHWGDSHNTSVAADDKDAVGFIEDLRIDADGDLEGLTNWNELGREKILSDRLRYFSPSFHPNPANRHTGKKQGFTLYGGALLNDPFLSELPRMAASAHTFRDSTRPEERNVNKKLLAALAAALKCNFSDDASEETITAAALKYAEDRARDADGDDADRGKKLAAEAEALKLSREANAGLEAKLKIETDARLALAKTVDGLQKRNLTVEIDSMVDGLRRDRKIIAAEADDVKKIALAMGVDEATRIFGARKPVIPETGETHGWKNDVEAALAEETPSEASAKLDLAASELRKKDSKLSEADAYLAAIEQNPKLALAAQPPGTVVRVVNGKVVS